MHVEELHLQAGELTLGQLRKTWRQRLRLTLDESSWQRLSEARRTISRTLEAGRVTYGVNTGFGRMAQTRIAADQLGALQRNLLLSHATGVGEPLDDATVRLILLLKINGLARGHSGVRPEVIRALLAFLEHDLLPVIPAQGSVGASGDLAPLAHLSLPLLGEGQVRLDGEPLEGGEGLRRIGLAPLELEAKEGLALLNGTQVSTALALVGLFGAERSASAAFTAGALSVEAALGSRVPFDARIHQLRGQPGQIAAAEIYRRLLDESEIGKSHLDCDRVQDPYSLRCQPQVMGACLDQMASVAAILERESNAVSDNPLVFPSSDENGLGEILSGGNFHAEPVALASDNLALAIAEIGALAERRVALLIDSSLSQLPPFLVEEAGLNSGFMIAHVTAAALASENKSRAHPASVDSLPTSANQEDHVSMATFAAHRLGAMNANTRRIVAIELLAACQGLDLRRPLHSSESLERAFECVRKVARRWDRDRFFAPDIEAVAELVDGQVFGDLVGSFVDPV
nr:histidine ammonia-lyase-like [Nerophis lumbriciformis]